MTEAALGTLRRVRAGVLDVAFHESGPSEGPPVLLMHGFPYDAHAFAEVAPRLAAQGCRAVVPYLRGYGATQFIDAATPRSGQQAALGADLLALLDALALPRAVLAGYDWGGRAACVVAALWPERCAGLVSLGGYNIQNIAAAMKPAEPENELRYWYQYYFHSERGRAGLAQNRRALCRLLWQLWSPSWTFDDATFERSAAAFVGTVDRERAHRQRLALRLHSAVARARALRVLEDLDVDLGVEDLLQAAHVAASGGVVLVRVEERAVHFDAAAWLDRLVAERAALPTLGCLLGL